MITHEIVCVLQKRVDPAAWQPLVTIQYAQDRKRNTGDILTKTPSALDAHLGARISALRKVQQMTREHLARVAQIPLKQMTEIENGQTRVDAATVAALAKVMNFSVLALFEPNASQDADEVDALDELRGICVDEMISAQDAVSLQLILSLIWVLRENGVAGLAALVDLVRHETRGSN